MFEMLLTIIVAVAAFMWGLSNSVFVASPYRHYYWAALIIIIVLLILFFAIRRAIRRRHLNRIGVDEEEYVYYHKYNSPLYRAGYFISYLIQNIMFDYTYMRRNFNFCKGLNTYDDGVSEYYIRFRTTWYRYLKLLFKRHRLSMNKLKAFSCIRKNQLIYDQVETEEEKQIYKDFDAAAQKYAEENERMNKSLIRNVEGHDKVDSYYRKNTALRWKSYLKAEKAGAKIQNLVEIQKRHDKQDVDDYKRSGLR